MSHFKLFCWPFGEFSVFGAVRDFSKLSSHMRISLAKDLSIVHKRAIRILTIEQKTLLCLLFLKRGASELANIDSWRVH